MKRMNNNVFLYVLAAIPGSITFEGNFTDALKNASSPEFMNMAAQATQVVRSACLLNLKLAFDKIKDNMGLRFVWSFIGL